MDGSLTATENTMSPKTIHEMLVGRTIKAVRWMTDAEVASEAWDDHPGHHTAIELDDGTVLYASRDDEGNGPGTMFGKLATGETIYVFP
jgi:hypothetical protein